MPAPPGTAAIDERGSMTNGAGGGARAVVYGLIREGFQRVIVFNRHLHRAEGLVRLHRDSLAKTRELIPALFADMFGDPTFRGNVYRYNYWHHIGNWQNPDQGPECGQAGIRLDDAISGVLIYGNIFHRCAAGRAGFGGVQIHGGKDNVVDSNIFADCRTAISFSPWKDQRWAEYVGNRLGRRQRR